MFISYIIINNTIYMYAKITTCTESYHTPIKAPHDCMLATSSQTARSLSGQAVSCP